MDTTTAQVTGFYVTRNGIRATGTFATKREASLYATRNNRASITASTGGHYVVEPETAEALDAWWKA